MRSKVPKKNISGILTDIKKPDDGHIRKQHLASDSWINERTTDEFLESGKKETSVSHPPAKKFPLRKLSIALASFLIIILFLFGAGIYAQWSSVLGYFDSAGGQINGFLNKNNSAEQASTTGERKLSLIDLAKSGALWENAGSVYSGFENLSSSGLGLMAELDALGKNWGNLFFRGGGQELIGHLRKIKEYLDSINEANAKLSSLNIGFDNFLSGKYGSSLSLDMNLRHLNSFLRAFINWLSSPEDRHILVVFGNSSEPRPGGGFIGSYADAVFSEGSLKLVDVHDINDADRELEAKIIPPKPLQAIEKSWTIADSNWFFDYSVSAVKTIELMEESKTYAGKNSFDGVVAISPAVIGGILEVTGPIKLADRNLTIDKDNFLKEIQKEVQAAQAKGAPAKKIIAELTPEILLKLEFLNEYDGRKLMDKFAEWVKKKDIVAYFKDKDIQNFLDFYGASGRIFEQPSDFNGDYLAVSSANVGGGKSDFFINQKVFFKTQLNMDGTAGNHLEISRQHLAGKNDEWWYRLPSESYIQVFTPADAALSSFSGGWDRRITPKVNYKKSDYRIDPLVDAIDSTIKKNFSYPVVDELREFNKKIFGFWTRTNPGQTTKAVLDYSVRLFSPPSEGQKYQFVFEKQVSGSGNYHFEIYAPVGFFWQEFNSPLFEYESSNPDGRTQFILTMKKG